MERAILSNGQARAMQEQHRIVRVLGGVLFDDDLRASVSRAQIARSLHASVLRQHRWDGRSDDHLPVVIPQVWQRSSR